MPSLVFPTLCFFVSAVVLANSQMTFSDGWGKRSAIAPFALLADRHMTEPTKRQQKSKTSANLFVSPDEDTLTMNPEMEACHAGYAQRLIQLHEQMLSLFSTYQQCQTKAAIETKKAMRQQS